MKVTVNNNSDRITNIAEIFHTDTNWYGFYFFITFLLSAVIIITMSYLSKLNNVNKSALQNIIRIFAHDKICV